MNKLKLKHLMLSRKELINMGKPTGFLEIERCSSREQAPEKRITHFKEFHKAY